MLKAILFAAGLTALLAGQASAETRFRGSLVFTDVKNCPGGSAEVGWDFRSEFHPRVRGNGDFTALSLVHQFGAIGNRINGKNFTSTYQTVTKGGVGWGDGYVPTKKGSILLLSQQPKSISPSTQSITLTGKFKNIWGDAGAEQCEVPFRGVYVQLVN